MRNPIRSARDGAESEFLFKAQHRDIDGAPVTAEIVRILRIHLRFAKRDLQFLDTPESDDDAN